MTPPNAIMHVRCRPDTGPETYRVLLDVLGEVSPVVPPVAPGGALVRAGAMPRPHRADPGPLASQDRVGVLLHGSQVRIGVAATVATAVSGATASTRTGPPGVLWLPDERAVCDFPAPFDIGDLYSVGTTTAATLRAYGLRAYCLTAIGALAATDESVVYRLVGRQGRVLRRRARGGDRRPVVARGMPVAATVSHVFDRDMLDPAALRAALLDLVASLAERVRGRDQVTRAVTLAVRVADGSRVERTRRLLAPSAHTDDLRTALWRIWDGIAHQRPRIRALTLTAGELAPADAGPGAQLSRDPAPGARHPVDPVAYAVNAQSGRAPWRDGRRPAGSKLCRSL
ncbi:hypothetical protein ACIRQF_00520 [Streptomyces sp. NPDC101191]|uniref:DinB/UmuC family translesion DNA polymerase n=1 Tax=Streptomyces sp. NPDC101191 TaxID=3366126 RepID=UPI003818C072